MNIRNLILACDSYKLCHHAMYPENTEIVYSYFEARTGAAYNKTVFFGLQYLLKEYLMRGITRDDIEEGEEFTVQHLGSKELFNRKMWEYILKKYEGKLPLEIHAVLEGTPIDINNVMMTVQNTDDNCFALTNHVETLLTHVWGPSTVATLSYEVKKLLKYYLEETGGMSGCLDFQLHDFGFRGVNQFEAAGIAGLGHLINFMGTDTIAAMQFARKYYSAPLNGLAYSVPATEHSVMTSMGENGEKEVFKRLLKNYPKGILSVVIDSYNYQRFISEYAKEFKDVILAREGKVVFRPDSGDPNSVTLDVLNRLSDVFGSTKNTKGYYQLNPKVGVLYGDGLNYNSIRSILYTMRNSKWCSDNIVFGMGGGLLQQINRDIQRFAFKSSAQKRNGMWKDIYKHPLDMSKVSKKGRLKLIRNGEKEDGQFITVQHDAPGNNYLELIFRNGELLHELTFDEVRKNASII